MNIAKKLLFSLLLCGSVFAAACGDDGKTAAAGATCDAETSCEANLVCVVDNDSATSGTCKATCNENSDCTSGNMTSCDDAKVLKDTTAGKVCMKPKNGNDSKVTKGGNCSGGKTCEAGTVCVSDICKKECPTPGDNATECTTEGTDTSCKAVGSTGKNACQAPTTVAKGGDCSGGKTCEAGTVCVSDVCKKECPTPGDNATECTSEGTETSCKAVGSTSKNACQAP